MPQINVQASYIYRKNDACIPFRRCFSEGDQLSSNEAIHVGDYLDSRGGSLVISKIQWELFSYSSEELLEILFFGSLRVHFQNCYFDYPLLNQKPKEVVDLSALEQIVQGADLVEELNKNMASKWNQIGTITSVTGCQVFPTAPMMTPPNAACQLQLLVGNSISLRYSLKVAINFHGTRQSTISFE